MRIEGSASAISWIPSEAIEGMPKLPFEIGIGHYDEPPPDRLEPGDLGKLRDADRFREANDLRAWIEVEDGAIVDAGFQGGGLVGSTTFRLGPKAIVVPGVPFEVLRTGPEISGDSARFVQTVGGRAGFPQPRRVKGGPLFRIQSATAWTTLALTLHADGRVEHEVVGASPFPRHWIYDDGGAVVAKSGLIDFTNWARDAYWRETPWGDAESPAMITAVETALERELSRTIMRRDAKPRIRELDAGDVLVRQGDDGHELFLLLDGVLLVEVDGEPVAELGPGAVLGERAALEGGVRTSSLVAQTHCRVAAVAADAIERSALEELAAGHRREDG